MNEPRESEVNQETELLPIFKSSQRSHIVLRYGAAFVFIVAGFGLRAALTAWVGPGLPTYITFYPMVMAVALLCGCGPGLLATVLAAFGTCFWILEPVGQFTVGSPVDQLGLVLFSVMGLVLSVLAEFLNRSRNKAAAYGRKAVMSELEFRSLAEAMPQIVWATRPDGWNIYFNQQWVDYTGMTMEESHGHGWITPFHPDDKQRAWEAWVRATQHNERYSLECRLRGADGTYRWWLVRGVPMLGRNGEILKWFGTCTDIEELKHAETALQEANDRLEQRVAERTATLLESEERFHTMVNAMPQQAWIARSDGHIVWYNQRWYEYSGTTPEQMEGWGWQSIHDPNELPRVLDHWKASIATGEPFEMTFPLRGADGRFRLFLSRGFPLKNKDGRVLQWFGTNTDVEDLTRAEAEIRRLNTGLEQRVRERTEELESSNKELEAFSYSVSHDLRAPLRAVDGYSQIVLEDFGGLLPKEGQRYLRAIREGVQKMGTLIDDLLAFSRLTSTPLNKTEVNTSELVHGVLEELSTLMEGRQIDLRVGELPTCLCDQALMKQVWINLLSNAFKYTQKREVAVVKIGCKLTPEADIYFVQDNGTGFNMRYAEKLFGVFQRLHSEDDFEGTGVGLAIVQRVIHRHGGRIWAEAQEGEGATFYFTLNQGTKQ